MTNSLQSQPDDSDAAQRVVHLLPTGKSVRNDMLEAVRLAVTESLPALLPDAVYTTEQLCGPDLWKLWSDGERRTAGICLAGLVRDGKLPLERVFGRHEYPLRFRVK